jgi:hypothetical protein
MDRWQKDGFDHLEKRGYLPKLRELAMNMCAPFFWSSQPDDGPLTVLHNGTICFVRTPNRGIGITANHVYQEYLADLQHHPNVEAQFGGNTIRPERQIIDFDDNLDLATFDVPDVFIGAGPRYFHEPPTWPPKKLEPQEMVLYGGYPGTLKEFKPGEAIYPFQSFTWRITDVDVNSMVMHVDFKNIYWPGHAAGEPFNEDPGGISGGPVYRIIEADVDRLEIVGFVFEYYPPWEMMRARHVDRINADGTIAR